MTTREYRQSRFRTPPGGCDLLLVRHGESAAHVDGVVIPQVDGHDDPPLHPDGRVQAEQVAERLVATGEPIAAIYVTTLQRTAQTAAPLAARLGLTPIVEPRLREVFLGEWEGGMYRRRVAAGDPLVEEMRRRQRWDVIPGAEPAEAFAARVRDALFDIARRHADQVVVAVAHGGVIGQAVALASGGGVLSLSAADNGSITHLVAVEDRLVLRCFNDTAHLGPRFSTAAQPLL